MTRFDPELNAHTDLLRLNILLTVRRIHVATLRSIAEAWGRDREATSFELGQFAARADGHADDVDSAAYDLFANLGLENPADVTSLTPAEGARLLAELEAALAPVGSLGLEDRPLRFVPGQQDRRAA
ncbi:hypothetical protein [Kitasatospora griseola]|uniref:hypothetical protein n=1 Tax=Kitasatospora griseola TaxID=2064 RepID=UPI003663F2E6